MNMLWGTAVVFDLPDLISAIASTIVVHVATTAGTHHIAGIAATSAHTEQMLQEFRVRLVLNLSQALIIDLVDRVL